MTETKLTGTERQIGDLDCVVIDTAGCDERVDCLAVFCHGFGAPGRDLVQCAVEFNKIVGGYEHVRIVFPAAPIQMDPTGFYDSRAWWPIDMEKLQQLMARGEMRDLRNEQPELLPERRKQLTELIDKLVEEASIGLNQVVLGGFSQGSMLATDVALSLPENLGGLVVWSGTLLNETEWREKIANRAGLQVVQSHGKTDPILPYSGAELLRDLFQERQLELKFIPFQGDHTIPSDGIVSAARMIGDVAKANAI